VRKLVYAGRALVPTHSLVPLRMSDAASDIHIALRAGVSQLDGLSGGDRENARGTNLG
jgi:hypothetical protein